METYMISIQTACLFFPLIAFLITLPYILIQYHKYGSIPFFRSTIIYSFVLYLMIMYFLVILPLPSIDSVRNLTTPFTQLIPFHFIVDFLTESGFVLTNVSTYLSALKHPSCYTVLFNVFLFVPLGMYLRYYFKCSFPKTILICFLVSLFFELTQLSGLYFIYPRPYRLFDVDDLIINTLGGMLGFLVTPILYLFLPSREKLDEWSYERGKRVSHFRRFVAFCIDGFLIIFTTVIAHLFQIPYLLYFFCFLTFFYYIIVPSLTAGRTLGKMIVQIKITTIEKEKPKCYQYLIRNGLLYFVILPTPFYLIELLVKCSSLNTWYLQILCLIVMVILMVYYIKFYIQLFISIMTKENKMFYETYSHTQNTSTILFEEKEKYDTELKKEIS